MFIKEEISEGVDKLSYQSLILTLPVMIKWVLYSVASIIIICYYFRIGFMNTEERFLLILGLADKMEWTQQLVDKGGRSKITVRRQSGQQSGAPEPFVLLERV